MIFSKYQASKHLLTAKLEKVEGQWILRIRNAEAHGWSAEECDAAGTAHVTLKWFGGAKDFGYANPGCFQVWGVDGDGISYRIREYYRARQTLDWWAERVVQAYKDFDLHTIACDSAEPRSIRST